MKRNKANGITLIALVITIIVLLILAGVAIATLTGDNGVLTKAVLAKEATRGGEVKDYVRMAVAENAMAENTNGTRRTRTEVISELSAQGKLTAEEVAKLTDEENPVDVITIGGIDFIIIPTQEAFDIEIPEINAVYTHMLLSLIHI